MKDTQAEIDASKDEMSKAATLEQQSQDSDNRSRVAFAKRAYNADGAPIAWLLHASRFSSPTNNSTRRGARLESSTAFKEPELSGWMKYNWLIEIPQADYSALGRAIADLENAEPLLSVTKLTIHGQSDQPEFQTVDMVVTNYIQKKQ